MLEADPVLGAVIANYPSDRNRPLLAAAVACGFVGAALFVLLSLSPTWWAEVAALVVMALTVLAAGWHMLHVWNREVVLYARGFTYREGSREVHFFYTEIRSIRQYAERLSYFGGRVRRDVYRFTVTTHQDEVFVLTNVYRRIGELGERLETLVNQCLRPVVQERLARGESVSFGDSLRVSTAGLHDGERHLSWANFGGYKIEQRRLHLLTRAGEVWLAVALNAVDNLLLLIDILRDQPLHARV